MSSPQLCGQLLHVKQFLLGPFLVSCLCFFLANTAQAQLLTGGPGDCFTRVLPDELMTAAPRVRHCVEGSYHPDGTIRPDDPAFFGLSNFGLSLSRDFVDALAGGATAAVPSDVDLIQHFGASSVITDSVFGRASRSVSVENSGGVSLAGVVGGETDTAGAGWGSHTTVELIPFSDDGSSGAIPVSLRPRFSGKFFGNGEGDGEFNSRVAYSLKVQTRNSETGLLDELRSVSGIVGFNSQGRLVSDGAISNLSVTLDSDGSGSAEASFRKFELLFDPQQAESLIVTTSFTGFGSFAQSPHLALADGSETSVVDIASPDPDVKFQHASAFRLCLSQGGRGGCGFTLGGFEVGGVEFGGSGQNEVASVEPSPYSGGLYSSGSIAAPVPEPTTLLLTVIGTLLLPVVRTRQPRHTSSGMPR